MSSSDESEIEYVQEQTTTRTVEKPKKKNITQRQAEALKKARLAKAMKKQKASSASSSNLTYLLGMGLLSCSALGGYYYLKQREQQQSLLTKLEETEKNLEKEKAEPKVITKRIMQPLEEIQENVTGWIQKSLEEQLPALQEKIVEQVKPKEPEPEPEPVEEKEPEVPAPRFQRFGV